MTAQFESLRDFEKGKSHKLTRLYCIEVFKILAQEVDLDIEQFNHIFKLVEDYTCNNLKWSQFKRKICEGKSPFYFYEQAAREHWDVTVFLYVIFEHGYFITEYAMTAINKHIDVYNRLEEKYKICGDRLFFLLAENKCPLFD